MRNLLILSIAVSFLFFGCTHTLMFTHFENGTTFNGLANDTTQMITVTMPDGEVLMGKYTTVRDAVFSFSSGSGFSRTRFISGTDFSTLLGLSGQAYALLKSQKPNSKLMMEIIVSYTGGHGFGEARTNDGRSFRVQF